MEKVLADECRVECGTISSDTMFNGWLLDKYNGLAHWQAYGDYVQYISFANEKDYLFFALKHVKV